MQDRGGDGDADGPSADDAHVGLFHTRLLGPPVEVTAGGQALTLAHFHRRVTVGRARSGRPRKVGPTHVRAGVKRFYLRSSPAARGERAGSGAMSHGLEGQRGTR